MLKLLGSLCVLSGGALAWIVQRRDRQRRRDTLSDFLGAFRRMAEIVRMARTPLPALLDSLAADCGSDAAAFFSAAADAARQKEDLSKAWQVPAECLPLSKVDKAAIASLGGELQGDEESVCKAISAAVFRLAKSAEELERTWPESEKQAVALCFSAAALLVILLI